jgi:hypothetical protein
MKASARWATGDIANNASGDMANIPLARKR